VVPWTPPPRCRRASHFFYSATAWPAPVQYEPAAEPEAQRRKFAIPTFADMLSDPAAPLPLCETGLVAPGLLVYGS